MTKQRGFLSIIAMIVIIIFGLLIAALAHMITTTGYTSATMQGLNKARNLARAAVEAGIYELEQSTAICTGSYQPIQTASTGEYQFYCTPYNSSTTLNGAITASANTLTLNSASVLAPLGAITIDNEVIYYNTVSGNVLSGIRRGMGGTVAASHANGASVLQNEFVVHGKGGSPTIASPLGSSDIDQAIQFNSTLFAGDTAGLIYSYNGSSWALTGANLRNSINGIYCLSSNNCKAVGNNGAFYSYNGRWATEAIIGSDDVLGISCINASNCLAVGKNNRFYNYNGSTWSLMTVKASAGDVNDVACLSATNCIAVGNNGSFYSYDGKAWIYNGSIGSQKLRGLSCIPSTGTCWAVASSQQLYYYNGSTWSFIDLGGSSINAISCINSSMCQAGGAGGRFYSYNGAKWTITVPVGAQSIQAITCLSESKCVAGSDSEKFYTYTPSKNWLLTQDFFSNSIRAISNANQSGITFITNNG